MSYEAHMHDTRTGPQKHRATLWQIVHFLAKRLGPDWKAEVNGQPGLLGPSEERLRIGKPHARRVSVDVDYGEYLTYLSLSERTAVSGITVSEDERIDVIAKAIEQRLLPKYRTLLGTAISRKEEFEAELAKKQENLEKLATMLGLAPDHSRVRLFFSGRSHISGHISTSADSASMNISGVPIDVAAEIVKLIASPPTAQPE